MTPRISVLATSLTAAAFIALVVGASVPAADANYKPQLRVTKPVATPGYVLNTQLTTSSKSETARLALYAPAGFKVTFPTSVGTTIGTASVRLELADKSDSFATLKGSIVVAAATTKVACVGAAAGTPAAVLTLNMSGDGLTMTIPVGAYPVTGAATRYSSWVLVQCMPPPGVAKGTAGRAPEGGRLVGETVTMPGLGGPENLSSYWTAAWTPYATGTANLDDAGSVAAQAVTGAARFPLQAKTSKQGKKTFVTLSGRVTRGQLGSIKASVNVYYGSRPDKLVSTRWQSTNATGRFSYKTQVTPPYRYFKAFARVPGRMYPSALCQPSVVPYPCTSISTTAAATFSNVVRVNASP